MSLLQLRFKQVHKLVSELLKNATGLDPLCDPVALQASLDHRISILAELKPLYEEYLQLLIETPSCGEVLDHKSQLITIIKLVLKKDSQSLKVAQNEMSRLNNRFKNVTQGKKRVGSYHISQQKIAWLRDTTC